MSTATTELPSRLYRAEDVRALDRAAIDGHGIAGATLMERAGAAAFDVLRQRWPEARHIAIVCGSGNNGGDGFVIARLAGEAGLAVDVWSVGEPGRVPGDALAHLRALEQAGIRPQVWAQARRGGTPLRADVVVDALLGTGLDRLVDGEHAAVISAMNSCSRPLLAIDIPSGLNADTGQPMGAAVTAQATVTFIGVKQGLLTGVAPDHCGRIYFSDLGVPPSVYDAAPASALRITRSQFGDRLRRRPRSGHKGNFGHVLVIGGDSGYLGAARMAAEAAARTGAGLVSVATRRPHAAVLAAACPVLMSHGVESSAELDPLRAQATVLAVGPGLGRSEWALSLLARVFEQRHVVVVDADALNLLAADPLRQDNWILTPHPGEAARLLATTTQNIQADRYAAARELRRRYGGVCVLKGAGTIIAGSRGQLFVCDGGNPGMGSGGMGDVLTGVIAGLLAQGLSLDDAACLGVCLHAEAGDRAAEDGERGLIATDLLPWLRRLANC